MEFRFFEKRKVEEEKIKIRSKIQFVLISQIQGAAMKFLLPFALLFIGAAMALTALEMESGIRQTQHLYNRKVDFLFGNCLGATTANKVCQNALDDLVSSIFCADGVFEGWCSTSDPTLKTCGLGFFNTSATLKTAYWAFATGSFANVTHHFLTNENYQTFDETWSEWWHNTPQEGTYSAYFQQFAKAGPQFPPFIAPGTYLLIIGYYNTDWLYNPSSETFCMKKFLTYNQNFLPLPGLVDVIDAPQLMF